MRHSVINTFEAMQIFWEWTHLRNGDIWGMETFGEWRHLGNGDIRGMETFGEWRHSDNGDIRTMETFGEWRHLGNGDIRKHGKIVIHLGDCERRTRADWLIGALVRRD